MADTVGFVQQFVRAGKRRRRQASQGTVLILCLSRETLAFVHNLGLSEEQMKQPDAENTS